MGFKAERGDSISVVNIAFKPMDKQELISKPFWQDLLTMDNFKSLVQYLISLLVIYYLTFNVLRPLLKRLPISNETVQTAVSEQQTPDLAAETPRPETDLEIARRMANENPRIIATVIKNWLNEE
jgi:flagellar M-ring protein FliF